MSGKAKLIGASLCTTARCKLRLAQLKGTPVVLHVRRHREAARNLSLIAKPANLTLNGLL